MSNRGLVILDRDGVINVDSPLYIKSADEFQPITGSIEAIVRLYKAGFTIYVATNQAGLAKGKFSLEDLTLMHQKLNVLVESRGGKIEKIFYCPHHPDEQCECRKPKPGLLLRIAEHAGQTLNQADFVGDSLKDIEAALAAHANPVLVLTGNGKRTRETLESSVVTFQDLADYADFKLTM